MYIRVRVIYLLQNSTIIDINFTSHRVSPAEPSSLQEIMTTLGDAVNKMVRFYYKPERERSATQFTALLLGTSATEMGLLPALELTLQFAFKSSRGIFRNKIFLWDFFGSLRNTTQSYTHIYIQYI